VCRFISVDPITIKYPELTPYQFASNIPIFGIDLDGLEIYNVTIWKNQFGNIYHTKFEVLNTKKQEDPSCTMQVNYTFYSTVDNNPEGLVKKDKSCNAPNVNYNFADKITKLTTQYNSPNGNKGKVTIETGNSRLFEGVVYFNENDAENILIDDNMKVQLDKLSDAASKNPDAKIVIDAYTNTNGTKDYNKVLSSKRADAVEKYLLDKGVTNTIEKNAKGQENTIKKADGSEDKEKSRRGEIYLEPK
jgi:outer membrane protein OmpA-like peptidoglycan-associated protein